MVSCLFTVFHRYTLLHYTGLFADSTAFLPLGSIVLGLDSRVQFRSEVFFYTSSFLSWIGRGVNVLVVFPSLLCTLYSNSHSCYEVYFYGSLPLYLPDDGLFSFLYFFFSCQVSHFPTLEMVSYCHGSSMTILILSWFSFSMFFLFDSFSYVCMISTFTLCLMACLS